MSIFRSQQGHECSYVSVHTVRRYTEYYIVYSLLVTLSLSLSLSHLIAKDPSNLKEPRVNTACDQPLQMELRGNAEDEVGVERVVVGAERTGVRPPGMALKDEMAATGVRQWWERTRVSRVSPKYIVHAVRGCGRLQDYHTHHSTTQHNTLQHTHHTSSLFFSSLLLSPGARVSPPP